MTEKRTDTNKAKDTPDYTAAIAQKRTDSFQNLVKITQKLREPGGCPWDREQTHNSLKPFAIEEAHEVVEAIETGDPNEIKNELGDLLFQVILHSQIASEESNFDISDVFDSISEKLTIRHPHVFSEYKKGVHGEELNTAEKVKDNWELLKKKTENRKSILEGLPKSLPSLQKSLRLSERAASTGFEFPDTQSVIGKCREEFNELIEAIENKNDSEIFHETGDLLFAISNLARFLKIDPEEALRKTNDRFIKRFNHIETKLDTLGKAFSESSLEEMEEIWNEAKELEKKSEL